MQHVTNYPPLLCPESNPISNWFFLVTLDWNRKHHLTSLLQVLADLFQLKPAYLYGFYYEYICLLLCAHTHTRAILQPFSCLYWTTNSSNCPRLGVWDLELYFRAKFIWGKAPQQMQTMTAAICLKICRVGGSQAPCFVSYKFQGREVAWGSSKDAQQHSLSWAGWAGKGACHK